jgi:hypothetical protein
MATDATEFDGDAKAVIAWKVPSPFPSNTPMLLG